MLQQKVKKTWHCQINNFIIKRVGEVTRGVGRGGKTVICLGATVLELPGEGGRVQRHSGRDSS